MTRSIFKDLKQKYVYNFTSNKHDYNQCTKKRHQTCKIAQHALAMHK